MVSNTGLVFTPIGLLCSGLPVWTGTIISQHNALAAYEDVIGVPTRIISILDEQMFFTHWLISIEGFTSWRIYEFRSTMNNGMPKQPHLVLQSHVFLFFKYIMYICILIYYNHYPQTVNPPELTRLILTGTLSPGWAKSTRKSTRISQMSSDFDDPNRLARCVKTCERWFMLPCSW